MQVAHIPVACSPQGYHGVLHDNLADLTAEKWFRLATEQARLSLAS